tara:strand:- start:3836 stop:4918 length:1083 start_codon:yes stop_codon:yes gene_type:complete
VTSKTNYLFGLDSLRGIAAISIVLLHFTTYLYPLIGSAIETYTPFLKRTYLFVDMFFIISGIVLTLNYRRTFSRSIKFKDYKKFLTKRLIKIYPLHVFTLLILVIFFGLATPIPESSKDFGVIMNPMTLSQNLLLLHSSGIADQGCLNCTSWNYPSWSISVEWMNYLILPILIWLSLRMKMFLLVVNILLVFTIYFFIEVPHGHLDFASWAGVLRCLCGVCTGISIANYREKIKIYLSPGMGLILILAFFHFSPIDTLTLLPIIYLVLSAMKDSDTGWFENSLFQYLGQRSYSLYMIHGVVHLLLGYWPQVRWGYNPLESLSLTESILGLVFSIFLTILLAELTYQSLELRLSRYLKSKI